MGHLPNKEAMLCIWTKKNNKNSAVVNENRAGSPRSHTNLLRNGYTTSPHYYKMSASAFLSVFLRLSVYLCYCCTSMSASFLCLCFSVSPCFCSFPFFCHIFFFSVFCLFDHHLKSNSVRLFKSLPTSDHISTFLPTLFPHLTTDLKEEGLANHP